jgi:hypothetical protein
VPTAALTWLLRGKLSAPDRRAIAEALYPPAPPPVLRAPVVKTVEVVRTVTVTKEVPAPMPAEHPVLGQLLHDFGRVPWPCVRAAREGPAQRRGQESSAQALTRARRPVCACALACLLHRRPACRRVVRRYKRVYAMCAAKLVDPRVVPVWNLQRSFRLERVRATTRGGPRRHKFCARVHTVLQHCPLTRTHARTAGGGHLAREAPRRVAWASWRDHTV